MRKSSFSQKHWFYGFLLLGAGSIIAGIGIFILFVRISVPQLDGFAQRKVAQSTKIYDRTGKVLLYDIHGEEKRTVIPFENIPLDVKNATIALEDDTFYQHGGIRPVAILRAMITNLLRGSLAQGGSTITQQLVKKTLLTDEKTIARKIKEAILAVKIERTYSKDDILNLYLNQIPYGSSAYGIESAAQTFFGKNAKDLTLLEAAYLVSLPKAPSFYSPCGKHRDELATRAHFALQRMKELNFITQEAYESANNDKIQFLGSCYQGIIAPNFVIEVRDQLNETYGEDIVERGGFKVTTTLDVDIQKSAETSVLAHAKSNADQFNAHNISVVSIDPRTGDILAMVGSKDYFAKPEPEKCDPGVNCTFDPQVNIATRNRQPGSAFKPFVYATAFKKGFTPDTVLFDVFTEFNSSCDSNGSPQSGVPADHCYHPQNYDDKFRGPVTLREALAQSLNIPSVKLLYLTGIKDSLSTAQDFGITSLKDPERLGLTLVLGGGEVSLLELTSAYGIFANDGVKNSYHYILKIEDENNNIIFSADPNASEVIDKNIARTISDILSDNNARSPAFGETSSLYFPGRQVAVKTGTTNDYRDAWIVGYTPSIVIGAWAGNNNNIPMEKKVAGFIIAPVWNDIMRDFLIKNPDENFIKYDGFPEPKPILRGEWRGGLEYIIDKTSGKLATQNTPVSVQEKKVVQSVHSILYWLNKNDPLGDKPSQPDSDPQFNNWEASVRSWASTKGYKDQDVNIIPKDFDDIHTFDKIPRIISLAVDPQKDIYTDERITIIPAIESMFGISQIDYFINDDYFGSARQKPYSISIDLKDQVFDTIVIRAKLYDSVGNTAEQLINISRLVR